MTQSYTHPVARERMASGLCPECGLLPETHVNDTRFWIPRRCDLLPAGVVDRIEHYKASVCPECGEECERVMTDCGHQAWACHTTVVLDGAGDPDVRVCRTDFEEIYHEAAVDSRNPW